MPHWHIAIHSMQMNQSKFRFSFLVFFFFFLNTISESNDVFLYKSDKSARHLFPSKNHVQYVD